MPTYQFEVRLSYFGFENFVEWTLYGTAFLFVVDFDECHRRTGLRTGWQWQLGALRDTIQQINLSYNNVQVNILFKGPCTYDVRTEGGEWGSRIALFCG